MKLMDIDRRTSAIAWRAKALVGFYLFTYFSFLYNPARSLALEMGRDTVDITSTFSTPLAGYGMQLGAKALEPSAKRAAPAFARREWRRRIKKGGSPAPLHLEPMYDSEDRGLCRELVSAGT